MLPDDLDPPALDDPPDFGPRGYPVLARLVLPCGAILPPAPDTTPYPADFDGFAASDLDEE